MACGCQKVANATHPPRDCSSLTVSDLQTFKDSYQCVLDNGQWELANLTENAVNDRVSQLNIAIADKQANPSSCTFYDYLDAFTQEVTNIILNTDC